MNHKRRIAILAAAVVSLIMLSPAEAQLLKKISKGIDKVTKGIEKVDKALNQKPVNKGTDTPAVNQRQSSSDQTVADEESADIVEESSTDAQQSPAAPGPYLTSETMFLEGIPWTLSDVSDGVFSIRRKGNSLLGDRYEFWKIDGKKLFDANWEKCTPATIEPAFHEGVVAMRKPREGYKNGAVCLLYTDGRVKELGSDIFAVTNFIDGAAIVWVQNSSTKSYYIDTTGKRLYPNLTVDGGVTGCMRPLKDGLRAFPKDYNKWGYIDASGVVKLAPQYQSATDFSEGYAWVVLPDNTKHLIDKTGKSIFQAPESSSKTSDVVNGLFYVEKGPNTCYYDLKGKMVGKFVYGTPFYDGYAFTFSKPILSNTSCEVINTDMNVVRTLPTEDIESAIVDHKLRFNKSNLYAFREFLIRPDGTLALRRYVNHAVGSRISGFRQVSPDGYFVAEQVDVNNNLQGAAILKTTGEVVWIISEDPGYEGTLNSRCLPYKGLDGETGSFKIKTVNIHQSPLGGK